MLHHKLGQVHCGGRFAYCSHCNKKWTYKDMVDQYVRKMLEINVEYVEKGVNKKILNKIFVIFHGLGYQEK